MTNSKKSSKNTNFNDLPTNNFLIRTTITTRDISSLAGILIFEGDKSHHAAYNAILLNNTHLQRGFIPLWTNNKDSSRCY